MGTTETIRKDSRQRPLRDVAAKSIVLVNTEAAPTNPYDGMIIYTDGVSYDPGSGEGVYAYYNSTWNKL